LLVLTSSFQGQWLVEFSQKKHPGYVFWSSLDIIFQQQRADNLQRWIFWINLPFCGIAFVVIPIFLQLHYKVGSLAEKLKQIDWVGTVIFVASVTSFLIPITWVSLLSLMLAPQSS